MHECIHAGQRESPSKPSSHTKYLDEATHRIDQIAPIERFDCYDSLMQTFSANDAKTRFGEFIDLAQREPVRVMRRDRVVGVMVSAQDYEAMRAFYANRLQHTLAETAARAEQAGLTPQALDQLLADES